MNKPLLPSTLTLSVNTCKEARRVVQRMLGEQDQQIKEQRKEERTKTERWTRFAQLQLEEICVFEFKMSCFGQEWCTICPSMCARTFCQSLLGFLSGHVRPRQGTEICNFGAPSPLEALHWILCFFSSIYVQFSKTSPLKSGGSSKKLQWRKSRQILSRLWLSWFFRPWFCFPLVRCVIAQAFCSQKSFREITLNYAKLR